MLDDELLNGMLELSDAVELEFGNELLELLLATLLLLGAWLLTELLRTELLLNEILELLDSVATEELDIDEFCCPSLQQARVNIRLTDPSTLMMW